jgi:hypothetical protein
VQGSFLVFNSFSTGLATFPSTPSNQNCNHYPKKNPQLTRKQLGENAEYYIKTYLHQNIWEKYFYMNDISNSF